MRSSTSKFIGAVAVSAAIMGLSATVHAEPLLYVDPANYDPQSIDPFTGIDWVDNASAVTVGFVPDGTTVFTTYYLASAEAIKTGTLSADLDGFTANGINAPTRWELTIAATIYETATCTNMDCSTASFSATGGTFEIYFNSLATSNRETGEGFTSGLLLISGNILPGVAGTFTTEGTGGIGSFTFNAEVLFTQTDTTQIAYINPELATSLGSATLQLGSRTTEQWGTGPVSFLDFGIEEFGEGMIVFQADGNQSFGIAQVPEPGTLALLGLGLLGLAGRSLRQRQA